MGTSSSGNIPPEDSMKHVTEGEPKENVTGPKYSDLLKPKPFVHENIRVNPKQVVMLHSEPSIIWKASMVQNMIIQENL
ncbi:hypothetical protein FXO38_17807 [Capsicum annuum]|nr:hypothetical protein FXO38_17807 [Capsicum annuum]